MNASWVRARLGAGLATFLLVGGCGAADAPVRPGASSAQSGAAHASRPPAFPIASTSVADREPAPATTTTAEPTAQPTGTPSAAASARPPRINGMPDVHVELDPPVARPAALCSIHGTDEPFDTGCTTTLSVASDARATKPMVVFTPHGVDVTFDVTKDPTVAAIAVTAGGVKVEGFTDIRAVPFHLAKEATAFAGHAHLLAGDPVILSRVDPKAVFVRTGGDSFNIEDVEAATTCDNVRFDGFKGAPVVPPAPNGNLGAARGGTLHLKGAPGEAAFFALKIGSNSNPFLMTELGTKGTDAHVSFTTGKARFDAWIDQGEIDFGDIGVGIGTGSGSCGKATPTAHPALFQVIDDTDVLVADEPGKRGPRGVRFMKGIFVAAHEAHGGWAEISIEPRVIAAAPGLHFFVPWSALRDPAPMPPPMDRE